MSRKQQNFLKLAQKISLKSEYKKAQMGAVLVKNSSVISIGINKNTPGKLKNIIYGEYKMLHAECDCLFGIDKKNIRGSTLYIAGYTKGGNYLYSKPCECCMSLIEKSGIKRIVYHDKEGNIYVEKIATWNKS